MKLSVFLFFAMIAVFASKTEAKPTHYLVESKKDGVDYKSKSHEGEDYHGGHGDHYGDRGGYGDKDNCIFGSKVHKIFCQNRTRVYPGEDFKLKSDNGEDYHIWGNGMGNLYQGSWIN